jgi:hypothetical protein
MLTESPRADVTFGSDVAPSMAFTSFLYAVSC